MPDHQQVFIEAGHGLLQINLPHANEEIMPDIKWGDVAGFPTIAYWLFKILEKRIIGDPINYKLGATLTEEIGACLLGGHGIPAANGIAAFKHMRDKGAFDGTCHSEQQLFSWLSEPIELNDKTFKYRFSRQKAKYLHHAIEKIKYDAAPTNSGKSLRNWLTEINGIGLKTASWIARNWLGADDVAILDIHIYRAGLLGGFFSESQKIEKDYLALEEKFIALAHAMKVKTSELDAVVWYEMQSTPHVHKQLLARNSQALSSAHYSSNNGRANPYQLPTL